LVLIVCSSLHRYSSHIFPSSVPTKILHPFCFFPIRKCRILKKEHNIFPPKFQKTLSVFPSTNRHLITVGSLVTPPFFFFILRLRILKKEREKSRKATIQFSSNKPNSYRQLLTDRRDKNVFWALLPARNCLLLPPGRFSCFLSPRLVN
jgi:hypothetical protein